MPAFLGCGSGGVPRLRDPKGFELVSVVWLN